MGYERDVSTYPSNMASVASLRLFGEKFMDFPLLGWTDPDGIGDVFQKNIGGEMWRIFIL